MQLRKSNFCDRDLVIGIESKIVTELKIAIAIVGFIGDRNLAIAIVGFGQFFGKNLSISRARFDRKITIQNKRFSRAILLLIY